MKWYGQTGFLLPGAPDEGELKEGEGNGREALWPDRPPPLEKRKNSEGTRGYLAGAISYKEKGK